VYYPSVKTVLSLWGSYVVLSCLLLNCFWSQTIWICFCDMCLSCFMTLMDSSVEGRGTQPPIWKSAPSRCPSDSVCVQFKCSLHNKSMPMWTLVIWFLHGTKVLICRRLLHDWLLRCPSKKLQMLQPLLTTPLDIIIIIHVPVKCVAHSTVKNCTVERGLVVGFCG